MSIGEMLAELWHIEFRKKCLKDADSALSVILAYFPGEISQPRFIQSTWFQGHFGSVL